MIASNLTAHPQPGRRRRRQYGQRPRGRRRRRWAHELVGRGHDHDQRQHDQSQPGDRRQRRRRAGRRPGEFLRVGGDRLWDAPSTTTWLSVATGPTAATASAAGSTTSAPSRRSGSNAARSPRTTPTAAMRAARGSAAGSTTWDSSTSTGSPGSSVTTPRPATTTCSIFKTSKKTKRPVGSLPPSKPPTGPAPPLRRLGGAARSVLPEQSTHARPHTHARRTPCITDARASAAPHSHLDDRVMPS